MIFYLELDRNACMRFFAFLGLGEGRCFVPFSLITKAPPADSHLTRSMPNKRLAMHSAHWSSYHFYQVISEKKSD